MNRVLADTEFFIIENDIWYRAWDGEMTILKVTDCDFVRYLVEHISLFYPKAYAALCKLYDYCARNPPYYRYRIASRFIRCNFSALDSIPDIDGDLHCFFEHVNCPVRPECKYDHVVCRPEFDHRMSPAELRVMALVYRGFAESAIADELCLSPLTVHTHIRNAYSRLGLHSKAEFMKYAAINRLFP